MSGFKNTERLTVYTHLRTFESDFDKSQSQIRAISAAWSGVVVGAIALIVTNEYTPPNGLALVDAKTRAEALAALGSFFCIIGSTGIYAFWFIDQRIYQGLLHSVFAYGLFIEFTKPDLPQIRSSMFIANLDVTKGLARFYQTQFILFFVISVILAGIMGGKVTWLMLALLGLHFLGIIFGCCHSQNWSPLRKLVKEIYGAGDSDLAHAMPEPGGFTHENETLRKRWLERIKKAPPKPDDLNGASQTTDRLIAACERLATTCERLLTACKPGS